MTQESLNQESIQKLNEMEQEEIRKKEQEDIEMKTEEEQDQDKEKSKPAYHAVIHTDSGIITLIFRTKLEMYRRLEPVRPENIIGIFRGRKLEAKVRNVYEIH